MCDAYIQLRKRGRNFDVSSKDSRFHSLLHKFLLQSLGSTGVARRRSRSPGILGRFQLNTRRARLLRCSGGWLQDTKNKMNGKKVYMPAMGSLTNFVRGRCDLRIRGTSLVLGIALGSSNLVIFSRNLMNS